MLVLQDDEERRNVVFAPKKNNFFIQQTPCVRSQHKLQQTICQLAPDLLTNVARSKIQVDVEIIGNFDFVRVLLNLFPQQYYYYCYYYYCYYCWQEAHG